jgi:virginiamycin B lyase
MWFTEEAGVKIGKIDMDGKITEYPVPALQKNDILASLAFDRDNNLWVQVYVDHNNPKPAGCDYILKFDKSIRDIKGSDLSGIPFSTHTVPSTGTMMHRIKMDDQGNLWFTEMMTDKLGKIRL